MKTLHDLIERNAANRPHGVAMALDGGRRLTYGQFAERSRRLGSALYRLGMRRQDRAGSISTNRLEFVELFGACEWSGYIVALYSFRSAAPELAFLLEDSAPRVLFFESQYADMIEALKARCSSIEHYVCLDGVKYPWATTFEDLIDSGDAGGPPSRPSASDYVYLFYTSGTTGRPKGVPYRHDGALDLARVTARNYQSGVVILQTTPMYHIGGKSFPLGAMWLAGTAIYLPSFEPERFMRAIEREGVTDIFMVAPMIRAVLDLLNFAEFDRSSLRGILTAAAPIPVPLLQQACESFGPIFYAAYGSTEAGLPISQLDRDELHPHGTPEQIKRLASVGHFIPEMRGAVLNERLEPCAPNEIGEVCVDSTVFSGYWNNTVATLESTLSGLLHTGDLGYLDEQNFLYLVDRKKDMIISGGENIYSREVEEALMGHEAVQEAAVVGVADPKWGESVKAFVVLKPGRLASQGELIDYCRRQIARFKCPKSVDFLADLPRTNTGKVDKKDLRKR